jgi:hypothetical protein
LKPGTRVPATSGGTTGSRLGARRATQPRTHFVSEPQKTLAVAKRAPSPAVYAPIDPNNSAETGETSDNDSKNTLRMEIQTNNPNIRIIWFSQKAAAGRVSPTSKGI